MKKTYIILLFLIFFIQTAFATISSIEKQLTDCLYGKYRSIDMIACTENATKQLESTVNKTAINPEFSNNQLLWNSYKTSTQNTIIKTLNRQSGSIYQEFSSSILFNIYRNRLLTLDYLNKKYDYREETYTSQEFKDCVTTSAKIKCYQLEQQKYKKLQTNILNQLNKSMTAKEYSLIKQNQNEWTKYKDDTINLINQQKDLSDIQRSQIMKLIYEERNSQLYCLKEIF